MKGTHPFDTEAKSVSGSSLTQTDLLSGPWWTELRTFLVVAKAGSVSRAAERLVMSRATVNRHIRRLQDVVSAQLLVTNATGVALTEKGTELANALMRVDHDLFALTREISGRRGVPEGIVRVSCPDGLGLIFVTPALKLFSEAYPAVQIHLNSLSNYRSLRDNSTDCMVAFAPDEHKDVTNIKLGWLHLVPIVTTSYIENRGMPNTLNLEEHDFLDSEKYSAQVPTWQDWHNVVRKGRTRHFADNSILYGMMVRAGLGIGLLASYTLQEGSTIYVDLGVKVRLPLYGIFLTDRLQSRAVGVVRDFLVETFGEHQRWFGPQFVGAGDHPEPGLELFLRP